MPKKTEPQTNLFYSTSQPTQNAIFRPCCTLRRFVRHWCHCGSLQTVRIIYKILQHSILTFLLHRYVQGPAQRRAFFRSFLFLWHPTFRLALWYRRSSGRADRSSRTRGLNLHLSSRRSICCFRVLSQRFKQCNIVSHSFRSSTHRNTPHRWVEPSYSCSPHAYGRRSRAYRCSRIRRPSLYLLPRRLRCCSRA